MIGCCNANVSLSTMNTESLIAQLRQTAEELVTRGSNLRAETSQLVADACSKAYASTDGLRSVVKAVAEGAIDGAKHNLPADPVSVLTPVIDGITDGLTKSAQAVKLTLEESTASGKRFAHEDLAKIGQDFTSLGGMISDIVTGAASALGGHAKDQASTLAAHAKQTFTAALPPLEAALHAATHHPKQLGMETVQASTGAAKQAAGVLFSELGKVLQKAGEKLGG